MPGSGHAVYAGKRVAVVIPALNEALGIGGVVSGLALLETASQSVIDDIVVVDNGSTDRTPDCAREAGARVVTEPDRGYGAACLAGIAALQGPDVVLFVDADNSVVSAEVFDLLDAHCLDAELVIGSRTLGRQEVGALTPPQRVGNWLASRLIRVLWRHPITDLGPFRAIDFAALQRLEMQDRRFGWTVEMQVKAIQRGLRVEEVPVSTRKRIGRSKISGTVSGVIGAALGIFGTIFRLWAEGRRGG